MKALILCAGNGTRLGYKRLPKCMAKVNGKPILEHLVNHLNKAGVTEIIVNVHKNYEPIFKYFGTRLLYLYEPVLLGEAGTEDLLQDWLGDSYIVMNGDTLTNISIEKLMEHDDSIQFYIERYGGTKFIVKNSGVIWSWDGDGAYYFDCGTPKKLAKARRYYKTLK
jgi:NDP-sugar pyrophosphorylase family protein